MGNSGVGGAELLFSIPEQLNFQHWKYFQVPWAGSNHRSMHMIIFLAGVGPVHMVVILLVKFLESTV